MSKSDILGPNAYFSDIENLVSFERAMFEDYSFKYRTKIFLLFMYTTLIADFADAAIDRGHSHRGRLSFGRSPSLPRVHVRDDRVE